MNASEIANQGFVFQFLALNGGLGCVDDLFKGGAMKKDYIDVPFEHTVAATDEVKTRTKEFFEVIQDKVKELVWQVANDYLESHMEVDVISNYQDSVRGEVLRCSYLWCRDPSSFWGKSIRQAIFDEHKDELLPLINNEQIEVLEKEIERQKAINMSLASIRNRY